MTATTLRSRIQTAQVAGADRAVIPDSPPPQPASDGAPSLPAIEYTDPIVKAEQVPVHVALARVMADVQSLAKTDVRSDSGGRYQFRGIDTVVNAVGPALRRHGVLALPTRVLDRAYAEMRTAKGSSMQECTLTVEWLIVGPMGDTLGPVQSVGQATDTQDKATAKAMSVAQRVMWLTCLHVPTHDPTIEQGHDRGEVPMPTAASYRDEVLSEGTSRGRMLAIRGEVQRHGLANAVVVNETGDEEQLVTMIERIGRERFRAPSSGEQ